MYSDQERPPQLAEPGAVHQATAPMPLSALSQGLGFDFRLSERRFLLIIVDSLLILVAIWGAMALTEGPAFDGGLESFGDSLRLIRTHWHWIPLLMGGWWLMAWLNDLYDIPSSTNYPQTLVRLAITGFINLLAFMLAYFLLRVMALQVGNLHGWSMVAPLPDPLQLFYYVVPTLTMIAVWRRAYTFSFDRPPFHHRVLIVGTGKPGRIIADALTQDRLRQSPGIKCKVIGYVDGNDAGYSTAAGLLSDPTSGPTGELPLLGSEAELPALTRRLGIHEVVVAMERQLDQELFTRLVDCQAQGVRVTWMPDLYSRLYRQFPIECIDPGWAMHAMQDRPIFDRLQQVSKRALDLIVVVAASPLLLLFLLPLAIAIRLDSKGPVFYRQVRLGRGNQPFTIVKFRTMYEDAEKDGQARWATENDPRITRVGRFLRKARLDEMPQIINVLRGEMSLVGPRPERPEFVSELKEEIPFYGVRLMVKPGITGWAQVHYDYGNSTDDALLKLQYDFYYIRYWSLWLDLYILYRTVAVVARLKGM